MDSTKLKVGTYNLQHGVLHQKRLETGENTVDLAATAAVLRVHAPDICALNEVYGNEESAFGNQPRLLAEALGYPHHTFARGIYHKYGEYGNGLLSKFPIRSARVIPLAIPKEERPAGATRYEDRALLVAELDANGKTLIAMVCHFGLNDDEKALAVDAALAVAKDVDAPIILMGDFNITPSTVHYARLSEVFSDTAALTDDPLLTFPSQAPRRKIDYIFTKGSIRATSVTAPAIVASDHLPIFSDMELQ